MWADSVEAWSLTPAHLVLLEEACRTADRCGLLDDMIRRLVDGSGDEEDGSAGITQLLAEARAQQVALKGIISELRQGQRQAAGKTGAQPEMSAGGSGVADLTARIAGRRAQAKS
ncbi:hypothetical protein [Streptomyces sp. NPDC020983]|uniref:hypothetical protein n=1 Tax=Streptomyces sp. NPDC020983 TaxID=3365106 RepID=UPI00379D4ED1